MSGSARRGGTAAAIAAAEESKPPTDLRLVGPAIAVWAGCLISLWAGAGVGLATAAVCCLLIIAALRARDRWPELVPGACLVLCFLAVGAVIAALRMQAAQADQVTRWAGDRVSVRVEAIVDSDPQPLESRFAGSSDDSEPVADQPSSDRFLIRVSASQVSGLGEQWSSSAHMTIFATGAQWQNLIPGDRIEARGKLKPDGFSVLPGAALTAVGSPVVLDEAPWWQQGAQQVRERFVAASSVLEPEPAGLLPGLILGDTTGISESLQNDAKASGLAHLLAVSGTHFAILCGAAMVLFRRAGPRTAALLGFLVLISLVILVRPGPSVLRAAVMGAVTLLAFMVGRTRTALPALAAAAGGLLLYDPTLAVNAGFALSVQATAGLVLVAPPWSQALQRRGVPAGWADLLVIPTVAHLATMPVIAALSGAISLSSVPANILVAPVVAPALIIGAIAAVLLVWWPAGAEFLVELIGPLVSWIATVAHLGAQWPLAQLPWPSSPAGVLALAAGSFSVVMLMRRERVRAAVAGLVAGVLVILVPSQALSIGWPPPGWLVVGCEVGQGDGFVLTTGVVGEAVVFDTGPDPSLMNGCLDRLQVQSIALLVLTHLHADHIDGLSGVLDGRQVQAIGVGPGRDPGSVWKEVRQVALTHEVGLIELVPGQVLSSGGARLTVLGPDRDLISSYLGPNDQSVVIRAEIDGVRILFTGDIEDAGQQALLDSGADLRAEVLKLPHHGSAKLLPEFVAAVQASVVMIGVGNGNDFGHPTASALASVTRAGARVVLRTDIDGDIALCLTDGDLTTAVRGPEIRAPA